MRALTYLSIVLLLISCNGENMSTPRGNEDCDMNGTWYVFSAYIDSSGAEHNQFFNNLKTDIHLDNIQSIIDNPDPDMKLLDIGPAWEFRADGFWAWGTLKAVSYEVNSECNELITVLEENGSEQTLKSDFQILRDDVILDEGGFWSGLVNGLLVRIA